MTGVSYFLCKVFLGLCKGIFSAISGVYALFYGLATAQFFNNDTIQAVSNNIYMFVSIVILFAFAVKIIEAIVNPDLLTDNKKGVTGVLTRTIIGLILIVAIPSIFNLVYKLQSEVITNSLVEKMILNSMDTDSSNGMSGAGGVLTSSIITGFIVPLDETGGQITEYQICKDDMTCNFADELLELNPDFEGYVPLLGSINDYDVLSELNIDKQWDNEQQIYEVNLFPLILIGLFILYQVILLCFDAGLRLVELGILQMMSPIVIVSYIAAGPEYLQKWAKLTGQKFLSVFIRIAALCLMVLGFRLMNDRSASIFNSESATFWFKVFVIIGLLRLVKELPDIISNIFGVDMKGFGGGIKGRLESMAGIGGLAGKAWSSLGKGAKGLAASTGLMAAGAIGKGIGKGAKAIDQHAFKGRVGNTFQKVKDSKFGRGVKVWASGVKAGGNISATGKALGDNFKKEFAGEIAEEKRKDDRIRDILASKSLIKNSKGNLSFDADGKVDWKATISNLNKGEKASIDVALDVVEGSRFSNAQKEDLSKLAKADYNLKASQYQLNNMDHLTKRLEAVKSMVGQDDARKIDGMIESIKKSRITDENTFNREILDKIAKMNTTTDMSNVNNLIGGAINAVEGSGTGGNAGKSQAIKSGLLNIQSQIASKQIHNQAELEAELNKITELDSSEDLKKIKQSLIAGINFNDNDKLMENMLSDIADLSAKDGAYYVDGGYDKLVQTVQNNQESYDKAKKKVEETTSTMVGLSKEEYEGLTKAATGVINHEFSEREIGNYTDGTTVIDVPNPNDPANPFKITRHDEKYGSLSSADVKKSRVAHGTTPPDADHRSNTNY